MIIYESNNSVGIEVTEERGRGYAPGTGAEIPPHRGKKTMGSRHPHCSLWRIPCWSTWRSPEGAVAHEEPMSEVGKRREGRSSERSSYELSTTPFPFPLHCSGVKSRCKVSEAEAGEKEGRVRVF